MSQIPNKAVFKIQKQHLLFAKAQWTGFHRPWEAALGLWSDTGNATSAFAYLYTCCQNRFCTSVNAKAVLNI